MSKSDPISATKTPKSSPGSAAEFSSNLGRALFQQRIESALLATKVSTGADGVAVSLRDGDIYVCRASVGCAPEIGVTVEPGQGICGRCIANADAVVEQDLEGEIKSVAAVPVLKDRAVSGFVAGFSLERNAFSQTAIDRFRELAASIHREIDPPVEIKLQPESEDEADDLLSQLGIIAPDESEQKVVQEDDSFLTDLVREVLGDVQPKGTPPLQAPLEQAAETTPKPFTNRTTDEVLMEIVPPVQARPAKPPASAPVEVTSNGLGAVPKAAFYPDSAAPEIESSKPTPAVLSDESASPIFGSADSPVGWSTARMAAIFVIMLALVGAVAYFMHSQKSAQSQPQQTAAVASAPAPKPEAGAQIPQVQTPTGNQAQPTPSTERQGKPAKVKTREEAPLIVAESDMRRSAPATDEPPPAAWNGVGANIPAPVLPLSTATVVFGGKRSTGAAPAKLIYKVDPGFPLMARSMHLSGEVHLEATVGTDGRVKNIRTVAGPGILATAAADAVRKWRYEPAKQNGKNVESLVEVKVNFR